ncbi:MAG: hypothetical protein ABL986_00235 [Vicinamibacterales bacterium]
MMTRRVLIAMSLAWSGGVAGLWTGAWLTPEGSGLAGPAIVFWWGVIGFVSGVVAGGLAAWKVSPRKVKPVSNAAVTVAGLSCLVLAALFVTDRRARAEARAQELARQRAPFTASVVRPLPGDGATFLRIDLDGVSDTFVMTDRRKVGYPVCRGRIGVDHHRQLLEALRRVDDLIAGQPGLCATSGDVLMEVRWTLPERGSAQRGVNVTTVCDTAHPEFTSIYVPIEGIAFTADLGADGLACEGAAPAN